MLLLEDLDDVTDEVRRLCTDLRMRHPAAKRVMLVSAAGGEGTTTVASLYSVALAENGDAQVLLIDANTRSPGVHRRFDIPLEFGLRDCEASVNPVIHIRPSGWNQLSLVTAGSENRRSLHALQRSGRLHRLAAQLAADFEFVVWDAPPFNIYPDAGFLAPFIDGAVIVVEADRSRIEDLADLRRRLDYLEVPMLGAVLNRTGRYFGARRARRWPARNGLPAIKPKERRLPWPAAE